jgi:tRNA(adenine34) deaminase
MIATAAAVEYMELALAEARAAGAADEVPVGAIVVFENKVVGVGQNRVLRTNDPTAHAEVLALRAAAVTLNNYRLTGCILYCTLEPCAMCAGAMLHARIGRLVFATPDPKAGAAGSVLSVANHPQLNHRMVVESGLLAEESSELLRGFFRSKRKVTLDDIERTIRS